MPKADMIETQGTVIEVLPNAVFLVQLDTGQKIHAHLSGKVRIHYIKIVKGDRVTIELSPYDLTLGRITFRMKHAA